MQRFGERARVVDDRRGVDSRTAGCDASAQRDRLGGHHVRQRAAEHERAAAVDVLRELLLAEHEPAARTAQRLVRGGRDDVRVRHRIEVAGEHLAGDEPREVRHVDHERRAHLVGDLANDAEVDQPRVRAVAGDQDQRPLFVRALRARRS